MPYVHRSEGAIVGLYANPQAGYAEEYLADDHADVVAFRNPPAPVPSLTPRQIRLALLGAGITEAMVDAALAGNDAGLIEWKFATQYNRDHPLISALAGSFGLTTEQVDALWLQAAQL